MTVHIPNQIPLIPVTILNEQEYNYAMQVILSLMAKSEEGSLTPGEEVRLESLVTAVQAYENIHWPVEAEV